MLINGMFLQETRGKNIVHHRRITRHWESNCAKRLGYRRFLTRVDFRLANNALSSYTIAAKDKANLVIAAKTVDPNPKLAGTIHSAAEESKLTITEILFATVLSKCTVRNDRMSCFLVRALGGQCLPVQVDVRNEAQV